LSDITLEDLQKEMQSMKQEIVDLKSEMKKVKADLKIALRNWYWNSSVILTPRWLMSF
jgi:peptidoglycan hydrolase CwlO-like protein